MRANRISTHGEMASILGVDRTLVSKYVSGARRCHDVTQLRRFAEAMDLPPETFGLLPEPDDVSSVGEAPTEEADHWRLVRRTLNRNRSELTSAAASFYWDPERIEGTACITLPTWMPAAPVELGAIELSWLSDAEPPAVRGDDPDSAPCRPPGPGESRYGRSTFALSLELGGDDRSRGGWNVIVT